MDITFYNKCSIKIEEYMKKTGVTKIWIAKEIGLTKQGLNGLEKSKNPQILNLIKLSTLLDCKIEELYSYEVKK